MTSIPALAAAVLLGQAYPQAPASETPARGAVQPPDAPIASAAQPSDAPTAAPSQAPTDRGQEIAALQAEVASLRAQVSSLEQSLESERARAAALEDRVRTDEERRRAEAEAAARSPGERATESGAATADMDTALQDLTRGDATGVSDSLAANAQALQATRAEAGRRGAAREAQLAGAAAQLIDTAREALSRSDLYQARIALGQAAVAAAQANALALEAAGAAAPQPQAQQGMAPPSGSGY